MKKYIIVLIFTSLVLGSCKDYLDLKPKNQIVAGAMEDVKLQMSSYLLAITATADNGINVSFNGRKIVWPFNRDAMANFAFYSDDIDMSTAMSNSYTQKYQAEYNEDGNWKGIAFANNMWAAMYTHIGYLNSVIKASDRVKEEDKAMYEMVKGEALAIRAFFVFKLLQMYAPYHDNNLGIPLNLDPDVVDGGARLTHKQVYKHIISDLNEALNFNSRKESWNIFNSKSIINSLLAQVYMFKATSAGQEVDDWKNAALHSAVIVNEYSLETTTAAIKAQFSPTAIGAIKNQPYALLTLGWKITPRSNSLALWGNGSQGLLPTAGLRDLYEPEDIRLTAYFNSFGMFAKHYIPLAVPDYVVMFRVADMYLINAEANIRLNDPKGKQLLAEFKQSRTGKVYNLDGVDLIKEVINERRKELCVEYESRWVDMKRLGIAFTRKSADPKLQALVDYTLESDDYRYALPIPIASELTFNNIDQNPGW